MTCKKIDSNTELQVLHEHYKDSFQNVRQDIRARGRTFIFILILNCFHFFQFENTRGDRIIMGLLKNQTSLEISVNQYTLEALIWFILFAAVVRYYQLNIYINRQYKYLHKLEEQFTKMVKQKFIFREGLHYLNDYPKFSSWLHILYAWTFPILVPVVGLAAILDNGVCVLKNWNGPQIFIVIFYLAIVAFTGIYLYSLHRPSKSS